MDEQRLSMRSTMSSAGGPRTLDVDNSYYFHNYGNVKSNTAIARLAALAQDTRLAVFRLLVQAGPEGVCVGDIGSQLLLAAPTLSFHLKELSHAGLVKSRQEGRFVFYFSNYDAMNELLAYLTENCCGGAPCEVACAPSKTASRRKKS